jgi:6-pyruvoyltetrahydropterin/6-carboxytetrahydropterin synthase
MKWAIDKSFDFCYGHRVHNQQLNTEYSLDGCLACRHLHGHQGKIKIFLESDYLQEGMVTDFKHLNWFKKFLDDTLDHKFIMDINDPLLSHEVPEYCNEGILDLSKCHIQEPEMYWTPDLEVIKDGPQAVFEKYEGMVFVDFVPTSENICAWLLSVAERKMEPLGVRVSAVEFWETPKSHCRVES